MRSLGDFDRALRIAAVLVALAAAFSVLILGIFATAFDTSTALLIGMGVVLAGLWVLLLMVVVRLAARSYVSAGRPGDRMAFLVSALATCVGVAALAFGTLQGLQLWMERPIYQEAAIDPATPGAF